MLLSLVLSAIAFLPSTFSLADIIKKSTALDKIILFYTRAAWPDIAGVDNYLLTLMPSDFK